VGGRPGNGGDGSNGAAVFLLTNNQNDSWLSKVEILTSGGAPGAGGASFGGPPYGWYGFIGSFGRQFKIPANFDSFF
jgi:hypothetical protein